MSFDYKKFTSKIYEGYKDDFSLEEVQELLAVDEDYELDSNHGKRLTINRIKFNGFKSLDEKISFDKTFDSGINLIVADNLKGKSSILKIIKFCLTGNPKIIRDDIKSWIKEIWLEFSIVNINYVIHIDITSRQKSELYKLSLIELLKTSEIKTENICFSTSTNTEFVTKIEEFFFSQFKFYNLQWTQKDSQKDSNKINTSNASWKTYYNYLNLESKDSNVMFFGGQAELSYQMLLGLKLTYPINRLKIKKERKEYNLSLLKNREQISQKELMKLVDKLEKEKKFIEQELKSKSFKQTIKNTEKLLSERKKLSVKLNITQKSIANKIDNVKQLNLSSKKIDSILHDNNKEISNLKSIYNKTLKKVNDLNEYMDVGIFFTNLDIQKCPHCYHDVDENKRITEKETKECMLCNHTVTQPLTDKESYVEKINIYKQELEEIKGQTSLYGKSNLKLQNEQETIIQEIQKLSKETFDLEQEEKNFDREYKDLGRQVVEMAEIESNTNDTILEIEKKEAILDYRINEAKKKVSEISQNSNTKYDQEILLLNDSIRELKNLRINENKEILNQLETLILEELKDIGIPTVEDVKIEENFKIKFKINGVYSDFDDVSEGEQLRVKLAFYLGLVQLNIQSGHGKHPKFLIIDSPAKEEGDKNFVKGLKKVIEEVTLKYEKQLQVIICTAERELGNIKVNGKKYIYKEDEFLF